MAPKCTKKLRFTTQRLTFPIQILLDSSVAESTKKVYQSAATAYLAFCTRLNLPAIPASENNLLLFIAELSQTKAYNTVHTYLAGVRHLHVLSGYPNPLESESPPGTTSPQRF